MWRVPELEQVEPAADDSCPPLSILVAGRDEADKLSTALGSLLTQDYPDYEVIFANDRSSDGSSKILAEFRNRHPHLQVLEIERLPAGWLGKTHALQAAYRKSRGEWLLFTDADVRFEPDVLRRSIALVTREGWDHLTLLAELETRGFWERTILTFFGLIFLLNTRLWAVSDSKSGSYVGMGAFQLLRRSIYESIGTHEGLALEVVDDIALGKRVKQGGFRSGVGIPGPRVRLRWQSGLGAVIRGLTKNSFAVVDYRWWMILLSLALTLLLSVFPFAALLFSNRLDWLLAALSAGLAAGLQGLTAFNSGINPLYGLTHPLGALLLSYTLLRSAVVTTWQGGVKWRGTFYSLDELRRAKRR